MNKTPCHLSIVVPAYNQARHLLSTLATMDAFLNNQPYEAEVIIVDDCSTDETFAIAQGFSQTHRRFSAVRNPDNLGKGASVKRGMELAQGTYRLFSDADLSTPIDEIPGFFDYVKPDAHGQRPFDIVIGSRRVKGARLIKRQPTHREALGRIFSVMVRLLTVKGFLDTQCGFKLFTAEAAKAIFPKLTIDRFGFDVEILFIARHVLKLSVKEAPVTWVDSPTSQVRLLRDATDMFIDLLRVRWNGFRGRYG